MQWRRSYLGNEYWLWINFWWSCLKKEKEIAGQKFSGLSKIFTFIINDQKMTIFNSMRSPIMVSNRGLTCIIWFRLKWKLLNNWFVFPLLYHDWYRSLGTKMLLFSKSTKHVFHSQLLLKQLLRRTFASILLLLLITWKETPFLIWFTGILIWN